MATEATVAPEAAVEVEVADSVLPKGVASDGAGAPFAPAASGAGPTPPGIAMELALGETRDIRVIVVFDLPARARRNRWDGANGKKAIDKGRGGCRETAR
jgi:hypothetical protein